MAKKRRSRRSNRGGYAGSQYTHGRDSDMLRGETDRHADMARQSIRMGDCDAAYGYILDAAEKNGAAVLSYDYSEGRGHRNPNSEVFQDVARAFVLACMKR